MRGGSPQAVLASPAHYSIEQVGSEIYSEAEAARKRGPKSWRAALLEWATRDEQLRTQLFRFVDVLPSLRSAAEIADHLASYLAPCGPALPLALRAAVRAPASLRAQAAAVLARRSVLRIARALVAGDTAAAVVRTAEALRARGVSFTADVLGEATTSEAEADQYAQRYLDLIRELGEASKHWPLREPIDGTPAGSLPRISVSLKLSALYSQFDPIAPLRCEEAVAARLRPILRAARRHGAEVCIDMEECEYKDSTLSIFRSVFGSGEFADFPHASIALQAYLRDAELDARELVEWAARRGCPVTVRLVKGAYWDAEVVRAAQRHWPCPVFAQPWETDRTFERLACFFAGHAGTVRLAIASHNLRSVAAALAAAENQGLSRHDFEFQMLYGMAEPLQEALVARGLHVRIYVPCGELIPGMGYLIRRLLENTSNQSFLRLWLAERAPVEELLAPPEPDRASPRARARPLPPAARFRNEPPADFRVASCRETFAAKLAERRAQPSPACPLVISGARILSGSFLESFDPSHPHRLVGRVARAGLKDADRAVAAARAALPAWARTPVYERAGLLRRLAGEMRVRRFDLAAWIVSEAGKPWREAEADVCEAIDYCEFYALEAERLAVGHECHVPGERNWVRYDPRGVAAIIAPWNFPLAILTGMTVAALVTGNTAVIKPAEQAPVVAARFFELLEAAGLPPGVAHFLPGLGPEVGAHVAAHPDVDLIAFTGSRAVGLQILEAAARTQPGQRAIKRVIAEMGGKNAIIVDSDADLDAAVRGIAVSAFSYAGQKCSACSRVIPVSAVHTALVRRLAEAARSLPIGPAEEPSTFVGPLIDAEAAERVQAFIEQGAREAKLACRVEDVPAEGHFVGPAIFDEVDPRSSIARQEIFGPVVAILAARDFDHALEIANDSEYGLTGGLYSRHPRHIEQAKRDFRVGNLYINRSITGALVGRQPFGGLKQSGIGSEAGGPDYLLQFCEPRTISENTVRHGFAPDVE